MYLVPPPVLFWVALLKQMEKNGNNGFLRMRC